MAQYNGSYYRTLINGQQVVGEQNTRYKVSLKSKKVKVKMLLAPEESVLMYEHLVKFCESGLLVKVEIVETDNLGSIITNENIKNVINSGMASIENVTKVYAMDEAIYANITFKYQ